MLANITIVGAGGETDQMIPNREIVRAGMSANEQRRDEMKTATKKAKPAGQEAHDTIAIVIIDTMGLAQKKTLARVRRNKDDTSHSQANVQDHDQDHPGAATITNPQDTAIAPLTTNHDPEIAGPQNVPHAENPHNSIPTRSKHL